MLNCFEGQMLGVRVEIIQIKMQRPKQIAMQISNFSLTTYITASNLINLKKQNSQLFDKNVNQYKAGSGYSMSQNYIIITYDNEDV